ncbi:MAG: ATPase P [Lachnospiraceae bacterium]
MRIEIPGYKTFDLKELVLDYNGTIATDGIIPNPVKERLEKLAKDFSITVLTADTHGTAKENCVGLPLHIHTFPVGNAMEAKAQMVKTLGAAQCVCMGNGRNDKLMFQTAELSIAIIGTEGACVQSVQNADICVNSIEDGLDLLLQQKRLIADLRG